MAINVVRTLQDYIDKMVERGQDGLALMGMKALLLDKDTTGIVALVHTQTHILSKEVYLVDRYNIAECSQIRSERNESRDLRHTR